MDAAAQQMAQAQLLLRQHRRRWPSGSTMSAAAASMYAAVDIGMRIEPLLLPAASTCYLLPATCGLLLGVLGLLGIAGPGGCCSRSTFAAGRASGGAGSGRRAGSARSAGSVGCVGSAARQGGGGRAAIRNAPRQPRACARCLALTSLALPDKSPATAADQMQAIMCESFFACMQGPSIPFACPIRSLTYRAL